MKKSPYKNEKLYYTFTSVSVLRKYVLCNTAYDTSQAFYWVLNFLPWILLRKNQIYPMSALPYGKVNITIQMSLLPY